jgi:ATP-binding cassette subfamily B protein
MLNRIKWLWRYYKKYPYVLAVLILMTPVQRAMQVAIPRLIEFSVDLIKTGKAPANRVAEWLAMQGQGLGLSLAATFALSLILLGVISTVTYSYVQSHRAWMNFRLEWLFRQDAFKRVLDKGPDFFNKFRVGDLVTRMTDDVADKLSWFACSGIFRFYEALLMVIFTLAMMASINPWLTLWSAAPLPLLIVIFFKSATLLDKRYDHLQTRISRFNDFMEACFSGIRVIKAYVKESDQKKRFAEAISDRRNAEISAIRATTVVDSLYMYIWQFGTIIVILAGGFMVMNARLSSGELVAFIYYVVYLTFNMFDIGQFLVKSRQSSVSIDRLVELEKVPPLVKDEGRLAIDSNIKGNLAFNNVSFAFAETPTRTESGSGPASSGPRRIINDISIEIPAGRKVALVGKIGSGKSWVANMIPRYVDPTYGAVILDGHDIREYRLDDLRRHIGFVPQEPSLFSDTVRNNVVFGREWVTEADVIRAIDVAQFSSDIKGFPGGLDTQIGTRGMSISGGQKQRLGLARALAGRPRILILDDCTSALDSQTEAALWRKLESAIPDMTVILITHRTDTLEGVDWIYVLESGSVVESGIHRELIAASGPYSKLYRRYQLEQMVS